MQKHELRDLEDRIKELKGMPASCVHFVQGASKEKRQSFEVETELRGICALVDMIGSKFRILGYDAHCQSLKGYCC